MIKSAIYYVSRHKLKYFSTFYNLFFFFSKYILD